jgi:hypothetical protein
MKHFMDDIRLNKIVTKIAAERDYTQTPRLIIPRIHVVYRFFFRALGDFAFTLGTITSETDLRIRHAFESSISYSPLGRMGIYVRKWFGLPDYGGDIINQEAMRFIYEQIGRRNLTPKADTVFSRMAADITTADYDELPSHYEASNFLDKSSFSLSTWLRAVTDIPAKETDKIKDVKEDFGWSLDEALRPIP